MRIIFTSIDNKSKALTLAKALVQAKLAACVQISAQGESVYMWEGQLCQEAEYYLSIKTTAALKDKVVTWLEANHPYSIPEIVVLDAKASEKYQTWLRKM